MYYCTVYSTICTICTISEAYPAVVIFKKSPDPSETTGLTLETSYKLIAKLLTVEKHAAENSNWF